MLKNDEWKYDVMPEIREGKNFADFIDPDILDRLEALEAEEEKLAADGFYDSDEYEDEEIAESDEEAIRSTAQLIRARRAQIKTGNTQKDKKQNKPIMPRTVRNDRYFDDMTADLRKSGIDPSKLEERAKILALARGVELDTRKAAGAKRKLGAAEGEMDVDSDDSAGEESMDLDGGAPKRRKNAFGKAVTSKGKHVPSSNRATSGLRDGAQREKARQLTQLAQRGPNRLAKASESDRKVPTKMPKHLFAGKISWTFRCVLGFSERALTCLFSSPGPGHGTTNHR